MFLLVFISFFIVDCSLCSEEIAKFALNYKQHVYKG